MEAHDWYCKRWEGPGRKEQVHGGEGCDDEQAMWGREGEGCGHGRERWGHEGEWSGRDPGWVG